MKHLKLLSALFLALALGACGKATTDGSADGESAYLLPTISPTDPVNPKQPSTDGGVDILLYNGAGVDTSDWKNTEAIIKKRGYSYRLINGSEMNAMSLAEMKKFGMFLFPGGYGGTIYRNINEAARLRIRQAVREEGLGYLGICAGAWIAVGPEAGTANTANYGFAIAEGSQLKLHRVPPDNVSMVGVKFADGSSRQLVIWGGPETPSFPGGVVGRYSDGTPAISQTVAGKGFVVVTGPHPEAPPSWRDRAGKDSDGLDYNLTYQLIDAALQKRPLAAF